MIRTVSRSRLLLVAGASALVLALLPAGAANAVTQIDGPVDLGTAFPFAVLAGETVTNTGPSVLNGDLGLSPGTSLTGFEFATVNGTTHATDTVAAQAQIDLTTAYGVAAGLTPTQTGLGDLTGLSLTPGVYSGGDLSVTGALTLEGTADAVWVFQAASTLTAATGSIITVTGGASACNVFWQVGSSATLNPGAAFVGTVMANVSVTAETAATVTGRLLARTGAVTLDSNVITAPTECSTPPGTVTSSPEITSAAPPAGEAGVDYSFTVTASGSPTPALSVASGELPPGLTFDSATGVISGQPTTPGTYTFAIAARNEVAPDAVTEYSVIISAVTPVDEETGNMLALSGTDLGYAPALAGLLLVSGIAAMLLGRRRARAAR